jgi:hypothetical protein
VFFVETAAVIWMILLLAVATATAAFALPRRSGWTTLTARREVVFPPAGDTAAADARAAAVERAAELARLRRAEWLRAQDDVDAAWAAFDAADRDARRAAAAAVFPVFKQRRTRAEIADRERQLHRSALAACRRRELSIEQLNEVLAHRGGWNPRRHPVAQDAALRAAVREHRFAGYQAATGRERHAWQESERAAAALRALRAEVLAAPATAGSDVRYEQWATVRTTKARLAVH